MRESSYRRALKSNLQERRRRHRGGSRLKAILWTVALLLLIYAGIELVPPYINQYQLQDKITAEVRFDTVNRKTDDQIRDIIFREIQDLNIPARREDIKVEINTYHMVRISVEYTVPVDLFFYHTELHFVASSENKSLIS